MGKSLHLAQQQTSQIPVHSAKVSWKKVDLTQSIPERLRVSSTLGQQPLSSNFNYQDMHGSDFHVSNGYIFQNIPWPTFPLVLTMLTTIASHVTMR